MNIFFDLYQQYKINKVEVDAQSAKHIAEKIQNDIYSINYRIDTVLLAMQALWEIMKERGGVTDEELVKKMEEIDLRDGVADGKMSMKIVVCPNCGRNNNSKRASCLYCGNRLPQSDLFGGI